MSECREVDAEMAMERLGGDPATLLFAIELMDRMLAKRRPRRRFGRAQNLTK